MSRSIVIIVAVFVILAGAWYFLMGPGATVADAPPEPPAAETGADAAAPATTGN